MDIQCKSCTQDYNLTDRRPKIMQGCCYEKICSSCICNILEKKIEFKCPACSQTLNFSKKEISIETFINDPTMEYYLSRQTSIKSSQQKFGEKQRPSCTSTQGRGFKRESQEEIEAKIKSLSDGFRRLDEKYKSIDEILESKRKAYQLIVKDRLKGLRRYLNNLELEVSSKIRFTFDVEKKKLLEIFGDDSSLKNRMQDKLLDLWKIKEEGHYEMNDLDTSEILAEIKFLTDPSHNQEYDNILDEFMKTFDSYLENQIKAFPGFNFPGEKVSEKLNDVLIENYNSMHWKFPRKESVNIESFFKLTNKDCYLIISSNDIHSVKIEEPESSAMSFDCLKETKMVITKLKGCFGSEEKLNALGYIWSLLTNVSSFKLDFTPDGVTNDQLLNLPVDIFKKKDIQEIEVNLKCCKVGDESVNYIVRDIFFNTSNLKSVGLNLSSTLVTSKTLQTLGQLLQPSMKNFEEFRLYLSKINIDDQCILQFFSIMPRLKKFALDMYYCTKITGSTIEAIIINIQPSLSIMEEFELSVGDLKVFDKHLTSLFVVMPKIKSFTLKVDRTKITDKCLSTFQKDIIPKMQSLETLKLGLKETKISEKSFTPLIENLKSLKVLKLDVSYIPQINDTSLKRFKSKTSLTKNLETFELNLQETSVTDNGVCDLFSNMPKMKNFSLNLNGIRKISDRTLFMFIKSALLTMHGLSHLSLGLSGTDISNEGIIALFNDLTNIKTLKSIELQLQNTDISDRSIQVFVKNSNEFKSLVKLNMDLTYTKVSKEVMAQVNDIKWKLSQNNKVLGY